MEMVAEGKMSEEELMIMQQKVLDGSEAKILATAASTGRLAGSSDAAFAGCV